jgi:hypothetical protein
VPKQEPDSHPASGCASGMGPMDAHCESGLFSMCVRWGVRCASGLTLKTSRTRKRTRNVRPDSQEWTRTWTRNRGRTTRIRGSIWAAVFTYLDLALKLSRKVLHVHLHQLRLVTIGLWLLSLHGTLKLIDMHSTFNLERLETRQLNHGLKQLKLRLCAAPFYKGNIATVNLNSKPFGATLLYTNQDGVEPRCGSRDH